jgi:hypothetical protein
MCKSKGVVSHFLSSLSCKCAAPVALMGGEYLASLVDAELLVAVLLWLHVIVMMRFLLQILCFLVPPSLPVPWITPALPRRLVADALLGMLNIDLILLRLLL